MVDAVLMYAQRGHGKRSSFYSDYTFGVWSEGESGDELVPVGKAYFGFTDEELDEIDRFVRNNTVNRFGPVREVVHEADKGLVLEVAFEGLQRSTRHKSGVAMRFPRISRLRWDKPPREADRLETLEKHAAHRGCRQVGAAARAGRFCGGRFVICAPTWHHERSHRRQPALRRHPLSRRAAAVGRVPAGPAVVLVGVILQALGLDPGNIIESIRSIVQARLGHGLRRGALAVALFPARRRSSWCRSG